MSNYFEFHLMSHKEQLKLFIYVNQNLMQCKLFHFNFIDDDSIDAESGRENSNSSPPLHHIHNQQRTSSALNLVSDYSNVTLTPVLCKPFPFSPF